jgi:hypothetical protein
MDDLTLELPGRGISLSARQRPAQCTLQTRLQECGAAICIRVARAFRQRNLYISFALNSGVRQVDHGYFPAVYRAHG